MDRVPSSHPANTADGKQVHSTLQVPQTLKMNIRSNISYNTDYKNPSDKITILLYILLYLAIIKQLEITNIFSTRLYMFVCLFGGGGLR